MARANGGPAYSRQPRPPPRPRSPSTSPERNVRARTEKEYVQVEDQYPDSDTEEDLSPPLLEVRRCTRSMFLANLLVRNLALDNMPFTIQIVAILNQEVRRWQDRRPLMLDFNFPELQLRSVCEFSLRELNRLKDVDEPHRLLLSIKPYLIHQMQTCYKPSPTTAGSLFLFLASDYKKWCFSSQSTVARCCRSWMKALVENAAEWDSKDAQGNNLLVQLIIAGLDLAVISLVDEGVIYQFDMVFDLNKAGQNAIDASTSSGKAHLEALRLMRQFKRTWEDHYEPYICSNLQLHLIPDLVDLCVSYITDSTTATASAICIDSTSQ